LPRDVDPGVRHVDGVTLLDLDDLKDFAQRSAELRRREIGRVREILASELERFRSERAAREVAPLIVSLRAFGEEVRAGEVERQQRKLDGLSTEQREAVEALTRGIVNKLLHEPTVRLKDAAGTGRGDYLSDALATLFDLPDVSEE
jgi:glutamyl-tRNA reductase